MKYKILLVEDDAWLAQLYQDILQTEKACDVLVASSADMALDQLDKHPKIKLILLDMVLPGHNGIEFLHEVASYADISEIPVIVLSSIYQHDFAITPDRWKHYGVKQYLYKPQTKPEDLLAAVKRQLAVEVAA